MVGRTLRSLNNFKCVMVRFKSNFIVLKEIHLPQDSPYFSTGTMYPRKYQCHWGKRGKFPLYQYPVCRCVFQISKYFSGRSSFCCNIFVTSARSCNRYKLLSKESKAKALELQTQTPKLKLWTPNSNSKALALDSRIVLWSPKL